MYQQKHYLRQQFRIKENSKVTSNIRAKTVEKSQCSDNILKGMGAVTARSS